MNYLLRYNQMISELQENRKVLVLENDFHERDELLPGFLEKHNYLYPLLNEIKLLNDNRFSWSALVNAAGTKYPMGEFHFLAIEEIMQQPLTIADKTSEDVEFYSFDQHPAAGDGIMGCLRFVESRVEIWLHTENGELIKLKLNLKEYLVQTIRFKALFGWQYLFANINLSGPVYSVVVADLNSRLQILSGLFPKENYQRFIIK